MQTVEQREMVRRHPIRGISEGTELRAVSAHQWLVCFLGGLFKVNYLERKEQAKLIFGGAGNMI